MALLERTHVPRHAREHPRGRLVAIRVLIGALIVQGIAGVAGGLAFLLDTDGSSMGFDPTTLDRTPLDTFLIPGLILLIPLGALPLAVAWALVRRPFYRWAVGIEFNLNTEIGRVGAVVVGALLTLWIAVEMLLIDFHWLQITFGFIGVGILALAHLPEVRRHYAIR